MGLQIGPGHSRSLSQPAAFFSLDSLPPLSPSPYRAADSPAASPSVSDPASADVSLDDHAHPPAKASPFSKCSSFRLGGGGGDGDGAPPRKAHRRSLSEVPFSVSGGIHSPFGRFQLGPGPASFDAAKPVKLVKRESEWDREVEDTGEGMGERKTEGETADELFSAYMNLDALNSGGAPGAEGSRGDDLDSRASGSKTNGAESSENEAESSVIESGHSDKRESAKRSFDGNLLAGASRHCRSLSMDSFMGKKLPSFDNVSPNFPPSPGSRSGHHSHSNSLDGNSDSFSLELGNGEFTAAEMKKIMANEKLAEMAAADPKRVKRLVFDLHMPSQFIHVYCTEFFSLWRIVHYADL